MNSNQNTNKKITKPIEIEKALLERIIELFLALQIIHDCNLLIKQGKTYHLASIYGQLRAILTDSTQQRNHKQDPLLLSLSQKLKIDLNFYINALIIEQPKELEELRENTLFQYVELGLSLTKYRTYHKEISIKDFLEAEVLVEQGVRHKMRNIINNLSNKFGGAHYDPTTTKEIIGLRNIKWNDFPLVDTYLIDFSDIVTHLGIKIPKSISDFEILFGFKLTKLAPDESYLFDIGLWKFRISLITKGLNLLLRITDLIGTVIEIHLDNVIELNQFNLFSINHLLSADFSSDINVYINEKQLYGKKLSPLLFFNNISECRFILNSSIEKTRQNFGFDFNWVLILNTPITEKQRLSILEFTRTRTMKEIGTYKIIDVNEYNELPPAYAPNSSS